MSLVVPREEDRVQWILDFQYRANNKSNTQGPVYILNVDTENPYQVELISLGQNEAIISTGDLKELPNNIWEINFSDKFFYKYTGTDVNRNSLAKKFVKLIKFSIEINEFKTAKDGAFPTCTLTTKKGKQKLGRAIPVTYDGNLLGDSMPINEISWSSFVDFHDKNICNKNRLYRGQADSSWDLIPSYFRISEDSLKARLLKHLRQIYYSKKLKSTTLVSRIVEAQHNEQKTALLDWTECPFIAAFFAFNSKDIKRKTDYIRIFSANTDGFYYDAPRLFDDKAVSFFTENTISCDVAKLRAKAQKSHFSFSVLRRLSTMHPRPNMLGQYWDIHINDREMALAYLNDKYSINAKNLGLDD
jgi:hypothetical protein